MNRRGFLNLILAGTVAPAIVRAESLMKMVVRPSGIIAPDDQVWSPVGDGIGWESILEYNACEELYTQTIIHTDARGGFEGSVFHMTSADLMLDSDTFKRRIIEPAMARIIERLERKSIAYDLPSDDFASTPVLKLVDR